MIAFHVLTNIDKVSIASIGEMRSVISKRHSRQIVIN